MTAAVLIPRRSTPSNGFRRRDFGHRDVEITISFPLQFEFLAETEFIESVCENEKDAVHAVGK